MPAPFRQVADRRPDHDTSHRQRDRRPPRRFAIESQGVGKVGEDPCLDVGDSARKEYARATIGTPSTAANTKRTTYLRVRKIAYGSAVVVGPEDGDVSESARSSPGLTFVPSPVAFVVAPRAHLGRRTASESLMTIAAPRRARASTATVMMPPGFSSVVTDGDCVLRSLSDPAPISQHTKGTRCSRLVILLGMATIVVIPMG